MKLNKIALAVIAATAMPVVASAGVTVTPLLLGYHVAGEKISDTAGKQRNVLRTGQQLNINPTTKKPNPKTVSPLNGGVALDDGLYVGAGIGIELTPTIALELEYGESNVDAQASDLSASQQTPAGITPPPAPSRVFDAKQKMYSANVTVGTETFTGYSDRKLKPYFLIGAGVSDISIKNKEAYTAQASNSKVVAGQNVPAGTEVAESKDTIGNLGLGAYYRINDVLSLRGEARAIHNFDNNWWEGMALAGLNVVLGGHLAPAPIVPPAPEPEPMPEPEPVPEPEPMPPVVIEDGDDDKDGVLNSIDACPNTPLNVVVDERGCPVKIDVNDALKMELRVFFDNDKSVIKDQYKPEIQKVAEKMNEYPNSTAAIEGHASKTGPSAKYNKRLSEARASAVKSMLVNQFGIAPTRISTVGYGYERPIAPNNTAEGRAMNRRVYAIITGNKTETVTQTKDMDVQP